MKLLFLVVFMIVIIPIELMAQSQADFTITISRSGPSQREAETRLLQALGAFASKLAVPVDLYQRDVDNKVLMDSGQNPLFDRSKVHAFLTSYFDAVVDKADLEFRTNIRRAQAAAEIEQQELEAIRASKPLPKDSGSYESSSTPVEPTFVEPPPVKKPRKCWHARVKRCR